MSSAGKSSEKSSQPGEDLYAGEFPMDPRPTGGKAAGLTQRYETKSTMGARPPVYDKRKYRYDRLAGMSAAKPVTWHVSKDDRMEADEAGEWLARVHGLFGLQKALPEELEAFNKSLFFCHTVNSGSVLQPGRSNLYVKGETFSFDEVVRALGVNIRRFFRAFADDVRAVNVEVLNQYTPYDPEKKERHDWLIEVATERGLSRFPDLAHDSADKCMNLGMAERMALANSKVSVFSSIVNSADRLNASSRVIGPDGFDSTTLSAGNTAGRE